MRLLLSGLLLFVSTVHAREKVPAGFPNAKTSGFVAAGVSADQLEIIEQEKMVITENGFVLENKKLTGSIFVKADNVTIKNCWILGTLGFAIRNEGKNLRIEYCKLETAGKVEGEGVATYRVDNNYSMTYCDVSGFGDGVKACDNTVIEHNYIHDLAGDPDYHSDCIQVMHGENIRIKNNTLLGRWKKQTSVIILKADKGSISNVEISNNFLSGGAYVFFNVGGKKIRFTDNTIEKGSWKWNGGPGYLKNDPVTYKGNHYIDGSPIFDKPTEKKAETGSIKITPVPWNGHAAAVALTFDDGFEDQLDNAIPELDARNMKGTFFLCGNKWVEKRKTDWAAAAASGHEIGNHSHFHLDPDKFPNRTSAEWETDINDWKNSLDRDLKIKITAYAHPFCNSPDYALRVIKKKHFIARDCGANFMIAANKEPEDWFRVEGRSTTGISQKTIEHEVTNALDQGKWITYYFHSIAGPWGGFPMKDFQGTLDFLKANNVWVDTYSRIGGYLKASLILSKVKVQKSGDERFIKWVAPHSFPENLIIKVTLTNSKGQKIYQNNKEIRPVEKGVYPINFSKGILRFKLKTEN